MHSCGTTLDPRWACRSQCPKVIYPPVKLIWLAGNSPFPIGNTSSNGGLFHCYVSLPEGNVHLTPCRAVVLLFVGLSRGMGRAHQHVPFFVVCFSYIFFGTRHFPREHLMSYSHCSRGKRPDLYFFRVTSFILVAGLGASHRPPRSRSHLCHLPRSPTMGQELFIHALMRPGPIRITS